VKEHRLDYEEKVGRTDFGSIVRDISYECKDCGSGVIGTINLGTPDSCSKLRKRLTADFYRKFPRDCEEAAKLNVCREIHDS
jgi:hypothetical protein